MKLELSLGIWQFPVNLGKITRGLTSELTFDPNRFKLTAISSAIDILLAKGMNIFRIPILMERMVPPPSMTGAINTTYLSGLSDTVTHVTSAGAFAVIDSQNFGRYNGSIFNSTSDFQTYWKNLATIYANNSKVIFDCNNEFHDEPSNALVVNLNQACIDGVRSAGATSQFIFVEGTVSPLPIWLITAMY
jgi:endoglucanase